MASNQGGSAHSSDALPSKSEHPYCLMPSTGASNNNTSADDGNSRDTPDSQAPTAVGLGIGSSDASKPVGLSFNSEIAERRVSSSISERVSQFMHRRELSAASETSTPDSGGVELHAQRSYRSYSKLDDREYSETASPPTITLKDGDERDIRPHANCPSRHKVVQKRTSWLSITILILAFYSTALSGLYLIVACVKPRYGTRIGNGGLSPSTASLLSALFAKTVELSFVTVFVAFLGQVLSRRALAKQPGVSIADMSMRAWIMQPGNLITHWENVRHAGLTIIGMIALIATLVAMLYTTAADALVSPKLTFHTDDLTSLSGKVASVFGNGVYLNEQCRTPITQDTDPLYGGSTCTQMSHVGQSYHNYQQYITYWGSLVRAGNSSSTSLKDRPLPSGTWYDNSTVEGSWIEVQDMAALSKKYGRMVNNVTAAMPHAGVYSSSRDPANSIRQPEDFAGQGEFYITASVPSPAVNVLCAGMTKKELEPIVYSEWPVGRKKFNASTWTTSPPSDIPAFPDWLNRTVVDELFDFGESGGQRAPIFPKLPIPYNTIVNSTGPWPATSIYILAASNDTNPPYVLCSLRGGITTSCSTQYHAASSGGSLKAHCEDPDDDYSYRYAAPGVESIIWSPDFKNIVGEWANSVSLGVGLLDGNASNARLLSQLTPKYDKETKSSSLDPKLPSIAEALAVLSSSTLLMSSEGSPFIHYWNYTNGTSLDPPVYEKYNASLRFSDYASGGTEKWQGIFYVVLTLVFLTNVICIVYYYLGIRGVQLTDFTEPQNMFALALNSPPSTRLSGACGCGPGGAQLAEQWIISMEENDEHYYVTSRAEEKALLRNRMANPDDPDLHTPYDSEDRMKPHSSPAVDEYRRLSRNRSSLSLLI